MKKIIIFIAILFGLIQFSITFFKKKPLKKEITKANQSISVDQKKIVEGSENPIRLSQVHGHYYPDTKKFEYKSKFYGVKYSEAAMEELEKVLKEEMDLIKAKKPNIYPLAFRNGKIEVPVIFSADIIKDSDQEVLKISELRVMKISDRKIMKTTKEKKASKSP